MLRRFQRFEQRWDEIKVVVSDGATEEQKKNAHNELSRALVLDNRHVMAEQPSNGLLSRSKTPSLGGALSAGSSLRPISSEARLLFECPNGVARGCYSTMIRSAHSTRPTKMAGLPNFAPD